MMNSKISRRIYHSKIFLIIYSLACTVWFIIRTGRKPSRIIYPCQKASASQSLWFWSYLIGSSPSFVKKIFERNDPHLFLSNVTVEENLLKKILLAIFLITTISNFSFNTTNQNGIRAKYIRGNEGFVTLTSKQNDRLPPESNDQNYTVAVISSDNPTLSQPVPINSLLSYEQVKDMVWAALDADNSPNCLKDVIEDNDWVVLKPNIVTAPLVKINGDKATSYWYNGVAHKGQNTDLRVVKAVIEYLVQYKNLRRITIAEGSAEWAKLGEPGTSRDFDMDGWTVHWQEFGNLSYEQIKEEINALHPNLVDLIDLSYDEYRYVEVPDPFQSGIDGLQREGYFIPATVLDCDKWIDIAAMKTHCIATITLAMKLRIGTLANQAYGPPESAYGETHQYGERGVLDAIIDLYCYHPADYAIVECIWGTEGQGPQWGNDVKRNIIIAGQNAIAVDAVGATLMGFNPWDLEYLHLAQMKNLGSFDLKKIDIIGESIDRLKYDFSKPLMRPDNTPYVGRANRTWLFNGIYQSTNLEIDFLGNESSVKPYEGMVSGGNQWQIWTGSADRLDLKQVFGDEAEQCIVYAFTYIYASDDVDAELLIGVDDGIKVYLNEQEIFSENQTNSYSFPEHRIPVSLSSGTNTLLCKLLNYSGEFEFRLNVSDDDGNTPLEVEYSVNNFDTVSISGDVTYYAAEKPVQNANLQLTGGINTTVYSNELGEYEFNHLPLAEDYVVVPQKIADYSPYTITSYDAALTAQMAVQIRQPQNQNQFLAADVDKNNLIQTYDAALIAMHAVGLPRREDSNVGWWEFVPDNRMYNSLTSSVTNQDYTAILLGDVDGNWVSSQRKTKAAQNKPVDFTVNQLFALPGKEVKIPVFAANNDSIISCDITMSYDVAVLKFKKINNIRLADDFKIVINDQIPGKLKIAGYGIHPIVKSGIYLEFIFEVIGKDGDRCDIGFENYCINNIKLRNHSLDFIVGDNGSKSLMNYKLKQNHPNPFNPETAIQFQLSKSGQVKIEIFNQLGQKVTTLINEQKPAGTFEVRWNGVDDSGQPVVSGVYFYKMTAGKFSAIKKMILIR